MHGDLNDYAVTTRTEGGHGDTRTSGFVEVFGFRAEDEVGEGDCQLLRTESWSERGRFRK